MIGITRRTRCAGRRTFPLGRSTRWTMGHRYQIPGLAFLLIFLGSSGSAQANAAQPVEASKAGGIAENVRILNDLSHGVSWGERAAEANEAKLKAMNESFLDMTIEMINHEKQRR